MNILSAKQQGNYNDKTVANCATALAFLSAYASDSAQLNTLYEAFDNTLNLNITIALKLGILLNGSTTP